MTLFRRHPAEEDLALFAGGELGPLARWRIEGHVSGCDRCRQLVTEFFETRSGAMDLAELPALDWSAMAGGVHARLAESRENPAPVRLAWRPTWGLAVALIVVLVAGVYVSRLLEPAPQPVMLGATAGAVEVRVGDHQTLTLWNAAREATPVNWRVGPDAVSARYLDADTGQVTVNNVYAQ